MGYFSLGAIILFLGSLLFIVLCFVLSKFISLGNRVVSVLNKGDKANPKLFKLFLAVASLASFLVISLWNWETAIIFMLAIGLHEYGHLWAMNRRGIKNRGFYFIPFLGGGTINTEPLGSRGNETFVALMGPLWGFGLSIILAAVYFLSGGWGLALRALFWVVVINLFNLIPISPLDGGRVVKCVAFSVHRKLGLATLAAGVAGCAVIIISLCGYLMPMLKIIFRSLESYAVRYATVGGLLSYATMNIFFLLLLSLLVLSLDLIFVFSIVELVTEWKRKERLQKMTPVWTVLSFVAYVLTTAGLLFLVYLGGPLYFHHLT